jgi:hypothetical protein
MERIDAPWVAGVEVEIKKKKRYKDKLSPKIM